MMTNRRLANLLVFMVLPSMASAIPDDDTLPEGPGGRRRHPSRRDAVLRLHLVRHGETEANRANLVLGQRESPLTELGIGQARALGSSPFGRTRYWRAYCSDFERTRTTAALILGGGEDGGAAAAASEAVVGGWRRRRSASSAEVGADGATAVLERAPPAGAADARAPDPPAADRVISDARLRERAKGVREGMPKSLTFEEALGLYRRENGPDAALPLLESDDDVWERFEDWVDELVRDVAEEMSGDSDGGGEEEETGGGGGGGGDYAAFLERQGDAVPASDGARSNSIGLSPPRPRVFNVLAVSHSATIRTAVNRMVGEQLPPDIVRGSGGDDGAAKGMLIIPNTSVTVIDVLPKTPGDVVEAKASSQPKLNGEDGVLSARPPWSANLVELTNTNHLASV